MKASARETALEIIQRVHDSGSYANLLLSAVLSRTALSEKDKALVTELVYGTLRTQGSLDWIIAQCSTRSLTEIPPKALDILRMGCYQLVYLTKIPARAACFESVELAKKFFHSGIASFVNGVLRSIARKKEKLSWPSFREDPLNFISLKYSHPLWLVKMWVEDLGIDETIQLCQANNRYPPVTIRTNTLKCESPELLKSLVDRGLKVTKSRLFGEGLVLDHAGDPGTLPEFKKGFFFVQDESSMAVSHVVSPHAGEAILDCCAAPGGKTTHMAELMQDQGRIVAVDIAAQRLNLIRANVERLGITSVELRQGDATDVHSLVAETFDKVLVDAPCSGLGALARRPDARWRKSLSQIEELSILQSKLLASAASSVRTGGALVYSVCTISHQEGIEVVKGFLRSHSDFVLDDVATFLPEKLRLEEPYHWVQFLPHKHGTDGMFIARMTKKAHHSRAAATKAASQSKAYSLA